MTLEALQQISPDPEKWKLAKRRQVPSQRHIPFQTKISRYYPPAVAVPYAGKISAELNIGKKNKLKRAWRSTSVVQHIINDYQGSKDSDVGRVSEVRLGDTSRKHFIGLKAQSQTLLPSLECKWINGIRPSRGKVKIRESHQARALLESQYPPFTATDAQTTEALVKPPSRIVSKSRRSRPAKTFSSFGTVDTEVPRRQLRSRFITHVKSGSEEATVFTYDLPKKRTATYHGCVASEQGHWDVLRAVSSITADSGFVIPKPTANVSDARRPFRRSHHAYQGHIRWDMLPVSEPHKESQHYRPVSTLHRTSVELQRFPRKSTKQRRPSDVYPARHDAVRNLMIAQA